MNESMVVVLMKDAAARWAEAVKAGCAGFVALSEQEAERWR